MAPKSSDFVLLKELEFPFALPAVELNNLTLLFLPLTFFHDVVIVNFEVKLFDLIG